MKLSKKAVIALILPIALIVGAWSIRPAFNTVTAARIVAGTGVSAAVNGLIPSYYTYYVLGSSTAGASVVANTSSTTQSVVLSGLANKGYSHLMVANNTSTEIALANTQPGITAIARPGSAWMDNVPSSSNYYVMASSSSAWDDVSIFDTIFLKSTGSSITSGNIDIMVW